LETEGFLTGFDYRSSQIGLSRRTTTGGKRIKRKENARKEKKSSKMGGKCSIHAS